MAAGSNIFQKRDQLDEFSRIEYLTVCRESTMTLLHHINSFTNVLIIIFNFINNASRDLFPLLTSLIYQSNWIMDNDGFSRNKLLSVNAFSRRKYFSLYLNSIDVKKLNMMFTKQRHDDPNRNSRARFPLNAFLVCFQRGHIRSEVHKQLVTSSSR